MNPDLPKTPREELEARITALLLGELPPEQAATLRQAIGQDAELSKLHERLKQTIHWVREAQEAGNNETNEPATPLRMSEERRQRLLAKFKVAELETVGASNRSRRMPWYVPMAIAAMLVAMLALVGLEQGRWVAEFAGDIGLVPRYKPQNATPLPGYGRGELALLERAPATAQSPASPSSHLPAGEEDLNRLIPKSSIVNRTDSPANREEERRLGAVIVPQVPPPVADFAPELAPEQSEQVSKQTQPSSAPGVVATKGASSGGVYLPSTSADEAGRPLDRYSVPGGPVPGSPPTAGGFIAGTAGGGFGGGSFDKKPALSDGSGVANFDINKGAMAVNGQQLNSFYAFGTGRAAEAEGRISAPEQSLQKGVSRLSRGFANTEVPAAPAQPAAGDKIEALERYGDFKADTRAAGRRRSGGSAVVQEKENKLIAAGKPLEVPALQERLRADLAPRDKLESTAPTASPAPVQDYDGEVALRLKDAEAVKEAQLGRSFVPQGIPVVGDQPALGYALRDEAKEKIDQSGGERQQGSEAKQSGQKSEWARNVPVPSEQPTSRGTAVDSSDFKRNASANVTNIHSVKVVGYVNITNSPSSILVLSESLALPSIATNYLLDTDMQLEQKTDVLAKRELKEQRAGSAGVEVQKRLSKAKAKVAEKAVPEEPPAVQRPATPPPVPQPEIQTRDNAFSTFSLNVSDVSFKLAGASLEKGQLPDPATVRSEEFINAFDYRDPAPLSGAPVAFACEYARDPFAHGRDLVRFSLKTAASGREPGRALNLVLLLDTSGSMERADRVRIIQEALRMLATQLQPQDRVSVVTFARTARLWADAIPGNQAAEIFRRVGDITPEGGTNLEEAMDLAYQTASRHYASQGVNRVVLLTDGAANLGNVEPDALKQKVESFRKKGIALDCFGIGWEGYNDDLLETLARNGDGRYGFMNNPEEAAAEFAGQLAGALQVAAADVKAQVEFNPARVIAYRQIGYAKHQLTKEQFRDNTVDAAEIGAAEAGNALYVLQVNPQGEGPLATVRIRYRVPATGEYCEHSWPAPYTGPAEPLEQASPALRLAATAAAFSEWLATSPYAGEVTLDRLLGYLRGVPETCSPDPRPRRLEWMIRQAKSVSGKP